MYVQIVTQLTIFNVFFFPYDTMIFHFVKSEIRRQEPPYSSLSLLTEGLAVGTLVCGGIGLVSTNQDPIQGAVVCLLAVMLALLNSTLNALVCMTIHGIILLFFVMGLACPKTAKTCISYRLTIDFFFAIRYNISGICEFSQICIMKGGNPVFEKKGILP